MPSTSCPRSLKTSVGRRPVRRESKAISCNCGCRFSRSSRSALTSSLVRKRNLSLSAFTIFQVPPLVDKGLTPLHMPVATARFMAERIKLKMLLTVCPTSIFRVGALALGLLVAFLGFVFPVGVFKSCALRLESKFGVRSAIGKAWILALRWAQYWL